MAMPTQARVMEYFNYDPETGVFTHLLRPREEFKSGAAFAKHVSVVGKKAGGKTSEGYVKLHIDGAYHSAHRIVYFLMVGDWPKYPDFEIDHINGDRRDNRWANLRLVTKSENQRNGSKRINNTSGVHGVNWKSGKDRWVARIWNGPRHVYLGQFRTLHEASIARKAAERALGFTGTDREPFQQQAEGK